MSNFMTFGDVSPRVGITAVQEQLMRIEPMLVLAKWAKTTAMPMNKGEIIKWRRMRPQSVSTTALTEGVTPATQNLVYEDVTTVLAQFGGIIGVTDKIADLSEDPVLNDCMTALGDQAKATKEMILWGVVRGGSAVLYANGTARSSVNTPVDLDLIRAGVNTLKRNHSKMLTKKLAPGPNIGTEAVGMSYIGVGHVDLERDIRECSTFRPVEQYGSGSPVDDLEIGKLENVRIILSPDLPPFPDAGGTATGMRSTTGTNADVYPLVIFGEQYFGDVVFKGASAIQMSVRNPKMGVAGDDLGQRGAVAWKAYYQAVRLNELWGIRLEVACTALS